MKIFRGTSNFYGIFENFFITDSRSTINVGEEKIGSMDNYQNLGSLGKVDNFSVILIRTTKFERQSKDEKGRWKKLGRESKMEQVRSGQVRSGQMRSGQVRRGQVRRGQVRRG